MAGYNLKEQGPTKDAQMSEGKKNAKGKKVSTSSKGASCKMGGFAS